MRILCCMAVLFACCTTSAVAQAPGGNGTSKPIAKRPGDTWRPSQVRRSGCAAEFIDRDSMPLLEAYALQ